MLGGLLARDRHPGLSSSSLPLLSFTWLTVRAAQILAVTSTIHFFFYPLLPFLHHYRHHDHHGLHPVQVRGLSPGPHLPRYVEHCRRQLELGVKCLGEARLSDSPFMQKQVKYACQFIDEHLCSVTRSLVFLQKQLYDNPQ